MNGTEGYSVYRSTRRMLSMEYEYSFSFYDGERKEHAVEFSIVPSKHFGLKLPILTRMCNCPMRRSMLS